MANKGSCDATGELRTCDEALLQMRKISAQANESQKKAKRTQYGVKEINNPLLHVPADIFQCTPFENTSFIVAWAM